MDGFIELTGFATSVENRRPILFRVESIEAVVHVENKIPDRGAVIERSYTAIYTSCDTAPFRVVDSYEDVKRLIRESGRSIIRLNP